MEKTRLVVWWFVVTNKISIGCQQQGHIINGTKLFHFPKVQQEFTKKIGFSSLSLGGMFLADDPLIYCACPTVAHLVGSQHYGQKLFFVQIVQFAKWYFVNKIVLTYCEKKLF